MKYLKHAYLLFSLSIISAIIIFNKLPVPLKEKISSYILIPVIIFIIFLFILFIFLLNNNFSGGKIPALVFIILVIIFFILSFLSAGQSFYKINSQIKLVFSPLNGKEIKNFYKINLAGQISSHPVLKNNRYHFNLVQSSLLLTENFSRKQSGINNIGEVSVCINQKDLKNISCNRDDMIMADVEAIKTSINKNIKPAVTFYVKNINNSNSAGLRWIFKIRRTIFIFLANKYKRIFPDKEFSFVTAVLLGNQDMLNYSLKNSFSKSGLYHMLSISGLHLSILFSVIFFILTKINILFFKKQKNILMLLCFILLLFLICLLE